MTSYDLFRQLADAYPAESLWTVGQSEPLRWWEISTAALLSVLRRPGCDPSGTAPEQSEYWRQAYTALEMRSDAMVSCEEVKV